MEGLARVFLIGGASKAVRYDEQTTIEVSEGGDLSKISLHLKFQILKFQTISPNKNDLWKCSLISYPPSKF